MQKYKTIIGVVVLVLLGLGLTYAYKQGKSAGYDLAVETITAKRDTVTVTHTDTLNSVTYKKQYVTDWDTLFMPSSDTVYVESEISIGSDSLGVSFTLRDYRNEYKFLRPSFHYPSRTITETKYVDRVEPSVYCKLRWAIDLSSEFQRFDLRLAPKLGLEFMIDGTRIYPYLGAEFSRVEPKLLYGVEIGL